MQKHPLPNRPALPVVESLSIHDLMDVTMQLKDILAKETDHLRQMKVKELGVLQQEKARLTKVLESYQALLRANPRALDELNDGEREDLGIEIEEFTRIVDDNYRRVAVARAVNQRIVQAILDVVAEQQHAGTYTKQGMSAAPNMALSFNLNQKA